MAINELNIYVTESKYVQAKLPNIVPSSLTFTNRKDVIRFKNNLLDEVHNSRSPYMFKSDWEEQCQKFNVPYFVSYWADQNKHVIDTLNQKEMPRYNAN